MSEQEDRELEEQLYILAELSYVKSWKERGVTDEDAIFPWDWYSIRNYRLKIEILVEALAQKCLIRDTEKYQREFQEGVR